MINLYSYLIFEKGIETISNIIASLDDITSLLNAVDKIQDNQSSSNDVHKTRVVNKVLNNLINDPDVISWSTDPNATEYELRRILKTKLNPQEVRYMSDICSRMLEIGNNGATSRINNLTTELLIDPDIDKWYKSHGDLMDLVQVISKKLNGSDKKYIQQITQNIYNMCNPKNNH